VFAVLGEARSSPLTRCVFDAYAKSLLSVWQVCMIDYPQQNEGSVLFADINRLTRRHRSATRKDSDSFSSAASRSSAVRSLWTNSDTVPIGEW
jgi:hypothetical protein